MTASGDVLRPRLYLSAGEVEELLDVRSAIALMRDTLIRYEQGWFEQLHRRELVPSTGTGALGLMPAYHSGPAPMYAGKVVCVQHGKGRKPSHHGLCLLFDGSSGDLVALLDAGAVTALRTAAVTAVATDALARPESSLLAVLGTGQQALPHIRAVAAVVTCPTSGSGGVGPKPPPRSSQPPSRQGSRRAPVLMPRTP